jgi:rRNA-processing protein FCF1
MVLKKIALDTNFLVYCAENKIDYKESIDEIMNEGYELIVPQQVLVELEQISKESKKYSDKQAAQLSLKILKANKIPIINVLSRYADDALIKLAKREGAIIATIDLELRKKLGRLNQVIVIEGIKRVTFD